MIKIEIENQYHTKFRKQRISYFLFPDKLIVKRQSKHTWCFPIWVLLLKTCLSGVF
jgi:hypothetical protein